MVAAGLTAISAVSHFAAYIAGGVMCVGAPSGNVTETVASGAVDALEVARVEPDGIAILRTPDHDRPWAYPDGTWTVEVQVTADGYRAGRIKASFSLAKSRAPTWVGEPGWL